jgi:hypothetical protein
MTAGSAGKITLALVTTFTGREKESREQNSVNGQDRKNLLLQPHLFPGLGFSRFLPLMGSWLRWLGGFFLTMLLKIMTLKPRTNYE